MCHEKSNHCNAIAFQYDTKLKGISVLPDIGVIFIADAEFSVIHTRFRHAEQFCDFGSFPAAHGIFQHFLFFVRQMHGGHKCFRLAVIVLFFLKAIHGSHWQNLIVRKVYVFYLLMPGGSVA